MNKRAQNKKAKRTPKKRRDLNKKQIALVKALPLSKTFSEAARKAGYADSSAAQRGLAKTARDMLDDLPMRQDTLR